MLVIVDCIDPCSNRLRENAISHETYCLLINFHTYYLATFIIANNNGITELVILYSFRSSIKFPQRIFMQIKNNRIL